MLAERYQLAKQNCPVTVWPIPLFEARQPLLSCQVSPPDFPELQRLLD
jgi:hypothetical protein